MFESSAQPRDVRVSAVASRRDGWHPIVDRADEQRTLLSIDASHLTADEALSVLVAVQEQQSRLAALEAELLVRAAGAHKIVRDVLVETVDGGVRAVSLCDEVVDEIACALRRSFGVVHQQVQVARLLNGPLRRTRDLLAAGKISYRHAKELAEQAQRMASLHDDNPEAAAAFAERCAHLQDRVLPHAPHETCSRSRARARRAVASIDAAGQAARRMRARRGCDVQAWGEDDGLGVVMARLSATDAAWLAATVEAHARKHADALTARLYATVGETDPSVGQLRAAALLDLIRRDGLTSGPTGARADVQIVIDAATILGLTPDAAAWVTVQSGESTPVHRDDVLALLSTLTEAGVPPVLRRLVADPATQRLVDRSPRTYSANADLLGWLIARDGTCRFPGCTRRAAACDVDHAVDHAEGGPTNRANTGMLCRRHHNRKTHAGWTITDSDEDGSCTWRSPTGLVYHHRPPPI